LLYMCSAGAARRAPGDVSLGRARALAPGPAPRSGAAWYRSASLRGRRRRQRQQWWATCGSARWDLRTRLL